MVSHAKFLLFALEIIKNYPNFNIIFKSKKDFGIYQTHEKTTEISKELLSYKNFKIADNFFFSPLICKTSDVVISMPFASTGLEAMCLGSKSFYVDLMNTYKNSYFDNFEKLVSHSKEDALNNLEYWIKIDKNETLLKYKKIFKEMGIERVDRGTEIIRNRIIKKIKK